MQIDESKIVCILDVNGKQIVGDESMTQEQTVVDQQLPIDEPIVRQEVVRDFDHYIVTDNGKLINTKTKKSDLGSKVGEYIVVGMSQDGRKKTIQLHILVATYFVPNPLRLSMVDHINRNKRDNRACNLRWVTCSENCRNMNGNGEYIDVLPEGSEEFKTHGKHEFEMYYVNKVLKQIYQFNGFQYRVLNKSRNMGYQIYNLRNSMGKQVAVRVDKL